MGIRTKMFPALICLIGRDVRCSSRQTISDFDSQFPQVVATALAFASVALPPKVDTIERHATKKRRAHSDVPSPCAVSNLS
jgi:hypothetical protein